MKFYLYFDGKTQFSQIFLGCIFFLGWGGGGGGGWGLNKSPPLSPVNLPVYIKTFKGFPVEFGLCVYESNDT